MASLSINPLSTVSDKQLKEACVALWDWPWCHNCDGKLVCTTITCSAFHSTRLSPFFDFYKQTTQGYVPELSNSGDAALRKHEDLIDIITYLRKNPNKRRDKATIDFFEARAQKENIARVPNARDQARAFNLAVRVLTMVNCAAENQAGAMLESGTQPVTWSNDATLNEFISKTFPTTDYPELNDLSQTKRSIYIKESLQGKRLQKMTGLAFKGTDDLRNHLKFDTDEGIIEVFTHTRFLKERLASTKDMEEALIGIIIPRQLALEVIDTIQQIMFPLDSESESILRSLVSKQGLDPDCQRRDASVYRRAGEKDIQYHYFGCRMVELMDEIENPAPRGAFGKWLQRKSGNGRYSIEIALYGLMFALVLGTLGLGLAIFQAWVAYRAWKEPVK